MPVGGSNSNIWVWPHPSALQALRVIGVRMSVVLAPEFHELLVHAQPVCQFRRVLFRIMLDSRQNEALLCGSSPHSRYWAVEGLGFRV